MGAQFDLGELVQERESGEIVQGDFCAVRPVDAQGAFGPLEGVGGIGPNKKPHDPYQGGDKDTHAHPDAGFVLTHGFFRGQEKQQVRDYGSDAEVVAEPIRLKGVQRCADGNEHGAENFVESIEFLEVRLERELGLLGLTHGVVPAEQVLRILFVE